MHANVSERSTLEYLINVQEVINMEAGNLSRIDKPARCKKVVKVGFFRKLLVNTIEMGQISKSINLQDVIRLCRFMR